MFFFLKGFGTLPPMTHCGTFLAPPLNLSPVRHIVDGGLDSHGSVPSDCESASEETLILDPVPKKARLWLLQQV